LPAFALLYYRTFTTQYIAFLERDAKLVIDLLSMEQKTWPWRTHS
jgi:hypothetical protein